MILAGSTGSGLSGQIVRSSRYASINFLTVHRDLPGRIDADTHLVAVDREHRDAYIVTEPRGFRRSAARELAFGRTP
jgi:hypothetical protein